MAYQALDRGVGRMRRFRKAADIAATEQVPEMERPTTVAVPVADGMRSQRAEPLVPADVPTVLSMFHRTRAAAFFGTPVSSRRASLKQAISSPLRTNRFPWAITG